MMKMSQRKHGMAVRRMPAYRHGLAYSDMPVAMVMNRSPSLDI
jgi:hypothetical protein